jgi:hypothetical protein
MRSFAALPLLFSKSVPPFFMSSLYTKEKTLWVTFVREGYQVVESLKPLEDSALFEGRT